MVSTTTVDQRSREKIPGRLTVRVVIDAPAGPANRYRLDPRSGQIELAGVDAVRPRALAERGRIPGTLDDSGESLQAVIPVRLPTFPGCVVPAHPIGITRPLDGKAAVIVAVPQ